MKTEVSLPFCIIICAIFAIAAYGYGFISGEPEPLSVVSKPLKRIKGGVEAATEAPLANAPRGTISTTHAVIQPRPVPGSPAGCQCQKIELSMTEKVIDGQPAMQLTTNDADIEDAVYRPYSFQVNPKRPWAVGISYDTNGSKGAFIQKDIGPFVAGAAIHEGAIEKRDFVAEARIGWRF